MPLGEQRQPVAHVPAEVVVQQPQHLAEVVAIGLGKKVKFVSSVIQSMMWRFSGMPRFVCQR